HGMYALNPQVAEGKTFLEETFNKTIFKLILNRTDSVIGLSKTIVNYAKKYGSKWSKYYVIPNGVDLDLYNGSLHKKMDYRLKYGLPVDNVVILFRGRFNYVKGVMEAAYAARYVTKHWSNVFFIFVGDGPLKNLIKKILNGLKNVKIYDWASTAAIHELYIASDIYLIPSKWEALPITLIEAMAARLYIISTKVGGIPDVLEGYPRKVFIASFDPKAIVEALEKALNKTCATNVTIDLRRCLKQFNWRSIVHTIENVYNETILRLSKVVSKSE
ncbi:MAG: glycosyltransferase family 4 protein, partial [Nitrososphaeria archaeon]